MEVAAQKSRISGQSEVKPSFGRSKDHLCTSRVDFSGGSVGDTDTDTDTERKRQMQLESVNVHVDRRSSWPNGRCCVSHELKQRKETRSHRTRVNEVTVEVLEEMKCHLNNTWAR